jgi:hypothetical protein
MVGALLVVGQVLRAAGPASAVQDGGPAFSTNSTSGLSQSVVTYLGPTGAATTQTDATTFWSTRQALTGCTVAVSFSAAPGAAASWAVALLSESTGFGATGTNSCADNIANMESTTICTVSGATQRNCTASIAPTIAANTCLQLKVTPSGTPTAGTTIGVTFSCTDATADGTTTFSAGNNALSFTTTTYFGVDASATATATTTAWVLPEAVTKCAGRVSVDTAPNNGRIIVGRRDANGNAALGTAEPCGSAAKTSTAPRTTPG